MDPVTKLAAQRAVVIFSLSSCCMCHTATRLFCELGVNPTVIELDEDPRGKEMEKALERLLGRSPAVPAVFIGGRLVGSTDKVMSLHLSGNLVPLLRNAGSDHPRYVCSEPMELDESDRAIIRLGMAILALKNGFEKSMQRTRNGSSNVERASIQIVLVIMKKSPNRLLFWLQVATEGLAEHKEHVEKKKWAFG